MTIWISLGVVYAIGYVGCYVIMATYPGFFDVPDKEPGIDDYVMVGFGSLLWPAWLFLVGPAYVIVRIRKGRANS